MIAEDFVIFDLKAEEEVKFRGRSLLNKEGIIQDEEGGVYSLEISEDGFKVKRSVPKGSAVSFGSLLLDEKEGEICECLGFYPLKETKAKIKHRGPFLEKYFKKFYAFGTDIVEESRAIGVRSGLYCLEMMIKRSSFLGKAIQFQQNAQTMGEEVFHSVAKKTSLSILQTIVLSAFSGEKNKFIKTQMSVKEMIDSGCSLKEIEEHVVQNSKEDGLESLVFVLAALLFSLSLSLEEIGAVFSLCVFPFPIVFYMFAICGSTIFLFLYEFEKTIN